MITKSYDDKLQELSEQHETDLRALAIGKDKIIEQLKQKCRFKETNSVKWRIGRLRRIIGKGKS